MNAALSGEVGGALARLTGGRDPDAQGRVGARDRLVDADARERHEFGVGLDDLRGGLAGFELDRRAGGHDLRGETECGEGQVGILSHDEGHLAPARERRDDREDVLGDVIG